MNTKTYEFSVRGLDVTIVLEHGAETVHANGSVWDGSDEVTERIERYSGYCDAEIVADMAYEMLATRRQIEWEDIDHGMAFLDLRPCRCE